MNKYFVTLWYCFGVFLGDVTFGASKERVFLPTLDQLGTLHRVATGDLQSRVEAKILEHKYRKENPRQALVQSYVLKKLDKWAHLISKDNYPKDFGLHNESLL